MGAINLTINVTKANGNPLAGAYVAFQLESPGLANVYVPGGKTDIFGQFVVNFSVFNLSNFIGQYIMTVTAESYTAQTQNVSVYADQQQSLTILLLKAPVIVSQSTLPPAIVCAYLPFGYRVTLPYSSEWRLVECDISDNIGAARIAVPVDTSGAAYVGFQGRIDLPTDALLVPDGQAAIIDPAILKQYSVFPYLTTDAGVETISGDPIEFYAANIYPTGTANDLTDRLNVWLTPFDPLPVWSGRYADAGIILNRAGLSVSTKQYNNAGNLLTSTLESIPDSYGYAAYRVKIKQPVTGATGATVAIVSTTDTITPMLNVTYL